MTTNKHISVVIPNFNYSEYIKECIKSVLDSDFDMDIFEIVVVDDFSTDNSINVIEEIIKVSPKNIKLIKNDTNIGLTRTRNRGIVNSNGEFIFFLDPDNYITKDCLRKHFKILSESKDISACYAPIQDFLDKNGEFQNKRSNQPFDYQKLLQGNFIDAMAMFRKKDLIDSGMYNTNMPSDEWADYELWLRFGKSKKKVEFINSNPLSFYRLHDNNMILKTSVEQYNFLVNFLMLSYPLKYNIKSHDRSTSIFNPIHNLHAQLYYSFVSKPSSDQNNSNNKHNFSDLYSKKIDYYKDIKSLSFKFLTLQKINYLRLDPLNEYAHVSIKNIKLKIRGKDIQTDITLSSNAIQTNKNSFLFDTKDPQIFINFPSETSHEIDEVVVELEYLQIGDEAFNLILKTKDELIIKQDKQISINIFHEQNMKEHIEEMNKLLQNHEAKLDSLQGNIENLNEQVVQKKGELIIQNELLSKSQSLNKDNLSKIHELEVNLKRYEWEIKQIKKSYSFRLTRMLIMPMTALIRLIFSPLIKHKLFLLWNIYLLKKTSLFDHKYYLDKYPDVKASALTPIKHFLIYGGFEGRNPSEEFESAFYLINYPDVKNSLINPLVHYLRKGKKEGRIPKKIRENVIEITSSQKDTKTNFLIKETESPHFNPPVDDYSFLVPFNYKIELNEPHPKIALICHLYYTDLLEELKSYFINIPYGYDLFITTDSKDKYQEIIESFSSWSYGKVTISIVPNKGRDIAPKLLTWDDVYKNYEYFLHIHTKKTLQEDVLSNWRTYLLNTLLGSEEIVKSVFEAFTYDKKLGIIAPQHYKNIRHAIGWGWNFRQARLFAKKMGIHLSIDDKIDFPSGSMFWGRSAAIMPLINSGITISDFPEENGQTDMTISHVIERLYYFVCEKAGYKWIKIASRTQGGDMKRVKQINNRTKLKKYINKFRYPLLRNEKLTNKSNINSSREIFKKIILNLRKPKYLNTFKSIIVNKALKHSRTNSYYEKIHENSIYFDMDFKVFKEQVKLHNSDKESLIDFDEDFYHKANHDVSRIIKAGVFDSGFVHYCLYGNTENRLWSNNLIRTKFSLSPNYPTGMFAPSNIKPKANYSPIYNNLKKNNTSLLLIMFAHLQKDLFYAGYSEFFKDFLPVFEDFDRIIVSVESDVFEPNLAKHYSSNIEVINQNYLTNLKEKPEIIIAFSNQLVNKSEKLFGNLENVIYYCQDYEAGFFPYGSDFIEAEKAVANSKNIIISTILLKDFLQKKRLLNNCNIFITKPSIELIEVNTKKSRKLFFYFRPEYFHTRNIPEVLWEAVNHFCNNNNGFEIYMVGAIETRFSFEINNNNVYILSKLPKNTYNKLISTCDVVVAMIYSAHPGVIAFQAAASGIPTITNIFENRDAIKLKQISSNFLPFDPIREILSEKIEEALSMPKGIRSFDEEFYSGVIDNNSIKKYINDIRSV